MFCWYLLVHLPAACGPSFACSESPLLAVNLDFPISTSMRHWIPTIHILSIDCADAMPLTASLVTSWELCMHPVFYETMADDLPATAAGEFEARKFPICRPKATFG